MDQENVRFEFRGFDPDFEMNALASAVAERIDLIGPSDAAMKMVIQKGKDVIEASCRIASQAGIFVAQGVSDSPIRAVQQLEQKIKDQLDSWKALRLQSKEWKAI